jgi:hypothetical protein
MTLDEIRTLLDFRDTPDANCAGVNTLLDKHIGHVADRIRVQLLRSQGFEALQLRDGVAEWNV